MVIHHWKGPTLCLTLVWTWVKIKSCLKDVAFIESLILRQAKNAWDISRHGLYHKQYSSQRQNIYLMLRGNHLRLDERRLKVENLKPMNPCMTPSCKPYLAWLEKIINHDQILEVSTPICSIRLMQFYSIFFMHMR